jgi:hypothetical protein
VVAVSLWPEANSNASTVYGLGDLKIGINF